MNQSAETTRFFSFLGFNAKASVQSPRVATKVQRILFFYDISTNFFGKELRS